MDTPVADAFPPGLLVSYPDRSTGLLVFGVIQIVLGLLCALMVPFSLLAAFLVRKTGAGMPAGYYVMTILTYTLTAAGFIALGIGSIRARRWGRNLTLVVSWLGLIYGALTTLMMSALFPSSFVAGFRTAAARNPQAPPLPAAFAAVMLTIIIAFAAFFLIVVPIIFIAFFGRKDVEETCKRRDPAESWTESTPLPVLAASIVLAIGAFYYLQMSFTIPMFPFFGRYLTGLPASFVCLVLAALDTILAIAIFKRRVVGWWIAVVALVLRSVAMAVTFHRGNLLEAYSRMGWSSQQLQIMQNNPMYRSGAFLWFGLVFVVLFLGYLIGLKRYFVGPGPEQPPLPASFGATSRPQV